MNRLYNYHGNKKELVKQILKQKDSINVPENIPISLEEDYKIARVLDNYLEDYFKINSQDKSMFDVDKEIDSIVEQFKQEVLERLGDEKENFHL